MSPRKHAPGGGVLARLAGNLNDLSPSSWYAESEGRFGSKFSSCNRGENEEDC
jgi:hypothetical protein